VQKLFVLISDINILFIHFSFIKQITKISISQKPYEKNSKNSFCLNLFYLISNRKTFKSRFYQAIKMSWTSYIFKCFKCFLKIVDIHRKLLAKIINNRTKLRTSRLFNYFFSYIATYIFFVIWSFFTIFSSFLFNGLGFLALIICLQLLFLTKKVLYDWRY